MFLQRFDFWTASATRSLSTREPAKRLVTAGEDERRPWRGAEFHFPFLTRFRLGVSPREEPGVTERPHVAPTPFPS